MSENLYKKSKPIDHLSSTEAIALMIKEQKDASIGVYKAIKSIEIATGMTITTTTASHTASRYG